MVFHVLDIPMLSCVEFSILFLDWNVQYCFIFHRREILVERDESAGSVSNTKTLWNSTNPENRSPSRTSRHHPDSGPFPIRVPEQLRQRHRLFRVEEQCQLRRPVETFRPEQLDHRLPLNRHRMPNRPPLQPARQKLKSRSESQCRCR